MYFFISIPNSWRKIAIKFQIYLPSPHRGENAILLMASHQDTFICNIFSFDTSFKNYCRWVIKMGILYM